MASVRVLGVLPNDDGSHFKVILGVDTETGMVPTSEAEYAAERLDDMDTLVADIEAEVAARQEAFDRSMALGARLRDLKLRLEPKVVSLTSH